MDGVTSRALSLLAALASPVFMAAAIAGWLSGYLPATPVTLGVAAFLVVGGPVLGIVHVATTRQDDEPAEEPVVAAAPVPAPVPAPVLTPRAEAAARFAAWRDSPNSAIVERERALRASRHLRDARQRVPART